MTCYNLNPLKTYVQFNDLVIDSAEEISSASLKQDTKTATQEYSTDMVVMLLSKRINSFLRKVICP